MRYLLGALLAVCLLVPVCSAGFTAENIALGKPVTFDPQPNYYLCTDPNDAVQMTDGKRAGEGFWTDIGAVGWQSHPQYHVVVDLGSVQPISRVVFSSAARKTGDVSWPSSILVNVSDDGVNYYYLGEMVAPALKSGALKPPDATEQRFDFSLDSLKTHGRYVAFSAFSKGVYLFTDEVEVYKGDDSFLNEKLPGLPLDYKEHARALAHKLAITQRLDKSVKQLSDKLKSAKISDAAKAQIRAKLDVYDKQIQNLPDVVGKDFRVVLPINSLEASVIALNGTLMQKLGYKPLTAWKKHRYDKLELLENPTNTKAAVSIEAMKNEYRADSFLITNSTSKPQTVTMSITGLPGSPAPSYLEVSAIPWTDTSAREPVTSALPVLRASGNTYKFEVPAGMTRPVWLTLDTSMLASGNYKGTIKLSGGSWTQNVPLNIKVSKVQMKRPRMSLGMWDYTQTTGFGAVVPSNIESAIKIMKSHYVDTPWASPGTLPYLDEMTPESFAVVDQWFKKWPEARHFLVFLNTPDNFLGSPINTPEFSARVGKWAQSIDEHMKSLNMDPKILGFLLIDEPWSDAQDEIIAAWAKAIKDSGAQLTLFEDTMWAEPEKTKNQEAITLIDILCPMLNVYCRGSEVSRQYWESLRQKGHDLWFYQCIGPVRLFDPAEYYRLTAWHGFKAGMIGMGFWAFGDTGGASSSWNEYAAGGGINYAPAFIDPEGVTDSVHWQAVREGILDYEYLSMLKDAIASSKNTKVKGDASKLLDEALTNVVKFPEDFLWKSGKRHNVVDDYRVRILRTLEKF